MALAVNQSPEDMRPAHSPSEYFRAPGTVTTWWDPLSESDPDYRHWFQRQLQELLSVIQPRGLRIMDAAAGRGRASAACLAAGASFVLSADISAEMLRLARQGILPDSQQGVAFVQTNLEDIPIADGTFDAVLLLEVLLHFERPDAVLREIARVLKPGGVLVVTTNGANPIARLFAPPKLGPRPASSFRLFAATCTNEVMTAAFGFLWSRTPVTARLYRRFFNVPVRPLYPWRVRALLRQAGFRDIYHRAVPVRWLPREHRWIALNTGTTKPSFRARYRGA